MGWVGRVAPRAPVASPEISTALAHSCRGWSAAGEKACRRFAARAERRALPWKFGLNRGARTRTLTWLGPSEAHVVYERDEADRNPVDRGQRGRCAVGEGGVARRQGGKQSQLGAGRRGGDGVFAPAGTIRQGAASG